MTIDKDEKRARRERARRSGVSYQALHNAERRAPHSLNLKSPSLKQLRDLLAGCDDLAAHHVLWVDVDGGVHIDPVPAGMTPSRFETELGTRFKFRQETYARGNGYVGAEAAEQDGYVKGLLDDLIEDWKSDARGYVDY